MMPAPLIILDAAGNPATPLTDLSSAQITWENNGKQELVFEMPAADSRAGRIVNEACVQALGETYRITKLERSHRGGAATIIATGQAGWYDLRRRPQIPETIFADQQADDALTIALDGSEWTVDIVTVTTRRSWTMPQGNPLECVQAIQSTHGGDLVFNHQAKTVSLVITRGIDTGVFFATGKNMVDIKKTIDTTQLATRLHATRIDDGATFASINNGLDYVEDYTYTTDVIDGYLSFNSEVSLYTMLAMTKASLGRYCKPATSYQATVADLSSLAGHQLETLHLGDEVTIWDPAIGAHTKHKVVTLVLDLLRPYNTQVTLDSTLRSLGSADEANSAVMTSGLGIDTRDLVPFNLLLNARFDNGLAHWAASGAEVVDGGVTGTKSIRFAGTGTRWIEQTVAADTRDQYMVSMQVESSGFPAGIVPNLTAVVTITYDDGTTEDVPLTLV